MRFQQFQVITRSVGGGFAYFQNTLGSQLLAERAGGESACVKRHELLHITEYSSVVAQHEEYIEWAVLIYFICIQLLQGLLCAHGIRYVFLRLPECLLLCGADDGQLHIFTAGPESAKERNCKHRFLKFLRQADDAAEWQPEIIAYEFFVLLRLHRRKQLGTFPAVVHPETVNDTLLLHLFQRLVDLQCDFRQIQIAGRHLNLSAQHGLPFAQSGVAGGDCKQMPGSSAAFVDERGQRRCACHFAEIWQEQPLLGELVTQHPEHTAISGKTEYFFEPFLAVEHFAAESGAAFIDNVFQYRIIQPTVHGTKALDSRKQRTNAGQYLPVAGMGDAPDDAVSTGCLVFERFSTNECDGTIKFLIGHETGLEGACHVHRGTHDVAAH